MFLILGGAAIICAFINISLMLMKRETKWFRYASLSLTALTLCSFLKLFYGWILKEDWSALMDVVGVSKLLIILTVISIVINGVSLFFPIHKQKDAE